MTKLDFARELADDFVTVSAIGSIAFLGLNGVTDTFVIGSIAGLGGYAVLKKRQASQSDSN